MPTTGARAYPYPAATEEVRNGWQGIKNLADAVDASLAGQVLLERLRVTNVSPSLVPLVVRGAASQTGDLLQLQNSATTSLAAVDSGGGIFSTYGYVGARVAYGCALSVTPNSTGGKGLVVRQLASQVADPFRVENSAGASFLAVDAGGKTYVGDIVGQAYFVRNAGYFGAALNVTPGSDGEVGIVVRSTPTSSGTHYSTQNSSGTNLASISSLGAIYGGRLGIGATPSSVSAAIVETSATGEIAMQLKAPSGTTVAVQQWIVGGTVKAAIAKDGRHVFAAGNTATSATAGAATALPGQPRGYFLAYDTDGVTVIKIPYYNN